MKIIIETIPHNEHRYETVGDYWIDENGDMQVRVSQMGNEMYEAMVMIHELTEFFLIRHKGTPTEEEVMAFDKAFEVKRELGEVGEMDEPGFAEDSPYRQEHTIATSVEMAICAIAGLSWSEYDKTVMSL